MDFRIPEEIADYLVVLDKFIEDKIKPLENKEYYRTIDGRNWLVHEVRYAIFPEQSGELQIPTQIFSARAADGRRSIFSRGSGRLVRRSRSRAVSRRRRR